MKGREMTGRDLFGAGTRLLGLYLLQLGLTDFVRVICKIFGIPMPAIYSLGEDLTAAVHLSAFGLILMFGANFITRLVYGRQNSN
jgi:hypothetical protein